MATNNRKTTKEKIEDSTEMVEKLGEAQINLDFYETEFEPFGTVRIHHPTFKISNDLDIFYTKEFNRLLEETDLPTMLQREEQLEERGAWTRENDEKMLRCKDAVRGTAYELATLKLKYSDLTDPKEKQKLLDQMEELNDRASVQQLDYVKLFTYKSNLFTGTVEKNAEKNVIFLKIVKCVTNEKDKPIFKSVEDVLTYKTRDLEPLINAANRFWEGIEDPLFVQSLGAVTGS